MTKNGKGAPLGMTKNGKGTPLGMTKNGKGTPLGMTGFVYLYVISTEAKPSGEILPANRQEKKAADIIVRSLFVRLPIYFSAFFL